MLHNILLLIKRYREQLLYLIFGVLTVAVDQASFMILLRLLPKTTSTIPTVIAWIIAVNFAYVVNHKWVFQMQSKGIRKLFREAISFYLARIFSLLLAVIIMWLLVDLLHYSAYIIKLAFNVLVVVINYLSSKFWVFRRGDDLHQRQKS